MNRNEGNYIRVTQMKVIQERVTQMKVTQIKRYHKWEGNTNKVKANEGNAKEWDTN